MSQSKVNEENDIVTTNTTTSLLDEHNNNNNTNANNARIQTRRSSRSARSASPVMAEDEEEDEDDEEEDEDEEDEEAASPASFVEETNTNTLDEGRVTRSQSVESSGYETTDSRKRKRKIKNTFNKKRADSYQPSNHTMKSVNTISAPLSTSNVAKGANNASNNNKSNGTITDDGERETRNTAQRMSKEAREAKKAQRDVVIKERLSELDRLEKAVKDGSHTEYHKLLSDIEQKRTKMLYVAEMRRSLAEGNVSNFFNSQKNAAYSQYYWDKLALRRSMIQHVQHKINTLEQEYYSSHVQSSLDDEHLSEWVPPDRPSMISSLTLGISEEEADHDLEWAKQDPREVPIATAAIQAEESNHQPYPTSNTPPSSSTYYRNDSPPPQLHQNKRGSSPPIDNLASLADRQYQKDFKEETTEKSFTLPPLNPWRYDRRPTLPT